MRRGLGSCYRLLAAAGCCHSVSGGLVAVSWFAPGLLSAIPVSFIFSLVESEYSCVYSYHAMVVRYESRGSTEPTQVNEWKKLRTNQAMAQSSLGGPGWLVLVVSKRRLPLSLPERLQTVRAYQQGQKGPTNLENLSFLGITRNFATS